MARITGGRSAYGHNVKRIMTDHYRLSWSFDAKAAGSRLRFERTMTRDADFDGAVRFAKKWGLPPPSREADPDANMRKRLSRDLQALRRDTRPEDQLAFRPSLPEEGHKNWWAITCNSNPVLHVPLEVDARWLVEHAAQPHQPACSDVATGTNTP
jgi:hypothetical protein